MAIEVERKYLIQEDGKDYALPPLHTLFSSISELRTAVLQRGIPIRQGYLSQEIGKGVADLLRLTLDFSPSEARLRDKAQVYSFTVKGEGGLSRDELEKNIDFSLFETYWPHTEGARVEKIRLALPYNGLTAEIDVYTDRDLILAEVEAPSPEALNGLPALGRDVTANLNYKNKNLARCLRR